LTTTFSAALGLASLSLLTASCLGESAAPGGDVGTPEAGNVSIEVASLDLPDVTSALYTLSVRNLSGQTIAAVTIDSADYGNGQGSATYITPCDADPNEQPNQVTATLVQLFAGNTPVSATMPPPIVRPVTCLANRDTSVELDFTVVRSAQQGFFDIKATVEDIFCSAKLDCSTDYTPNAATTVVIGFACGAGAPADVDTFLYMSDILVDCGLLGQAIIHPEGDGYVSPGNITDTDPNNLITGVRVYRGPQQLNALDALYWNVTFGITSWGATADCSVSLQATATDGSVALGPTYTAPYLTAANYPQVEWDVPITQDAAVVCSNHPVNGANGVEVTFPSDGWEFDNEYGGTGP
jgi:hypothetical protein